MASTTTVTPRLTTPVILLAGGYGVIGRSDNIFINGGAISLCGWGGAPLLANGADEFLISAFGQLLNQVNWTSTFPRVGSSQELSVNHLSHTFNDTLGNWSSRPSAAATSVRPASPTTAACSSALPLGIVSLIAMQRSASWLGLDSRFSLLGRRREPPRA